MANSETIIGGGAIPWPPGRAALPSALESVLTDFPDATVTGSPGSIQDLEEWHDADYRRTLAGVYVRTVPGASGVFELRIADEAAPWQSEWTARRLGLGTPLAPPSPLAEAAVAGAQAVASGTLRLVGAALALALVVAIARKVV